MLSKRDELKAKLLAKAEATIEAMLNDERISTKMTLSQIEQVIGEPERLFSQSILEELLAVQKTTHKTCPKCGGALENKGVRDKHVISVRGETTLKRPYYQCQQCGHGFFPP